MNSNQYPGSDWLNRSGVGLRVSLMPVLLFQGSHRFEEQRLSHTQERNCSGGKSQKLQQFFLRGKNKYKKKSIQML